MSQGFFQSVDQLRSLMASNDSIESQWLKIRPLLNDPDVAREFWNILPGPEWLPILREAGLFSSPPNEKVDASGKTRSFLPWSASQYLARMAKGDISTDSMNLLVAIVADIQTNNASINNDILDVGVALPAEFTVKLVPTISKASAENALWFGFEKACDICARLASQGQEDGAMELATALFSLNPRSQEPLFKRHEEEYWYTKGLETVTRTMIPVRAAAFCGLLVKWLNTAIARHHRASAYSDADYSYIWRPTIEESSENPEGEFRSDFVTIVRGAYESAVQEPRGLAVQDVVAILDANRSQIVMRLKVHLSRVFAIKDREIACATMLDRDLLESHAFKHEYALLMHDCWMLLSAEEKATWFDWVDSIVNSIRSGQGWDSDQPEERAAWWEYERLHWIRDHVDGDRRALYEGMRAEFGESELAGTNLHFGPMRWGGESPFTVEDLKTCQFADAVELVASWVPDPQTVMGPDREALANTFGQYVADDAAAFSRHAALMRHRAPIYVRTFLSKMEEAIKGSRDVDLSSVLELCDWVVEQPAMTRTDDLPDDVEAWDRSWQYCRDEITRLMEAVCKARSGSESIYAPNEYKKRIWHIVELLTKDSAQSNISGNRDDEDPRTHDYVGHAINSPRGKAIEAAFEYARWVGHSVSISTVDATEVPAGLDAIPEFRSMLEWQMSAENATVEAFAIIGMHIGLLQWLDKEWLAKAAPVIFSIEPYVGGRDKECGWASWNAFLVWVAPHVVFYNLLKQQYAYAIEATATVEVTERTREQAVYRLGEHLMILYGRGHVALDEEGSLIRAFLESGNPKVRQRAFSFIGWTFRREKVIPDTIANRFMAIWDFYWERQGKSDAAQADEDLFGHWFSTGHFAEQWSLDRLKEYVEIGKTVDADDELLNRLAEIASTDVSKALSILDKLVQRSQDSWRIQSWWKQAAKILQDALSGSGDVRDNAEVLIDQLGRRGFLEFGELLHV